MARSFGASDNAQAQSRYGYALCACVLRCSVWHAGRVKKKKHGGGDSGSGGGGWSEAQRSELRPRHHDPRSLQPAGFSERAHRQQASCSVAGRRPAPHRRAAQESESRAPVHPAPPLPTYHSAPSSRRSSLPANRRCAWEGRGENVHLENLEPPRVSVDLDE